MDCSKFRNGKFKTKARDGFPETTIERKDHIQIEKVKGQKGHSEMIVRWIDECTYTLTPTAETLAKQPSIPKNAILTVTIIKVKEKSYIQTTTSNFIDIELTSEIIQIK